jgi:hypothetical protein
MQLYVAVGSIGFVIYWWTDFLRLHGTIGADGPICVRAETERPTKLFYFLVSHAHRRSPERTIRVFFSGIESQRSARTKVPTIYPTHCQLWQRTHALPIAIGRLG